MKEKALPLAVIKALLELEAIVKDVDLRIVNVMDDNLMNLECEFADKTFFFKITGYSNDSNKRVIHHYEFMPFIEETFQKIETKAFFQHLVQHLKMWLILVKSYHDIDQPFKDKFLKYYEEQFANDIKILVDKEADVIPYDFKIQKLLHANLDNIIHYLEEHKTEELKEEYDSIIEESKSLQQKLNSSVRQVVAKNYIVILAKLWKLGKAVFEGALGNLAYDGLKNLLGF